MKKLVLIFVAFMLTGLTMKAQVDLQNGLVAYYPFNGNANDESGNGLNCINYGATLTSDRFGLLNNAFEFNGIDNYLSCGVNSLFENSTNHSTIAWFKVIKNGSPQGIAGYTDNTGDAGYMIYLDDRDSIMILYGTGYPDYSVATANMVLTSNTSWHCVADVCKNGVGRIYIDGVLQPNINNHVISFAGCEMYIGQSGFWGGQFFGGTIDDVRFYNRAITDQEIQTLYSGIDATVSTANSAQDWQTTFEFPITTTNLNVNSNIISYQFDLAYDNTKLQYVSNSLVGTIATSGSVLVNEPTPGNLSISYITTTPLQGAGDILKLQFDAIEVGTTTPVISNFLYNNTPATISNGTITIQDLVPPTADITYSDADGFVRFGKDLIITATFSEPIADSPIPQIALSGANTVVSADMVKVSNTVYTYTHSVTNGNGAVTVSLATGTDTHGNNITAIPTSGATFNVIPIKFGDVDDNTFIRAYDAALVLQYSVSLDPLPSVDPLPWEAWRIKTADVDGVAGVTANDASEILKYTVGLINTFAVSKKSTTADNADVDVTLENGEIVFRSSVDLFGLNVFVNENKTSLGTPQILNANMLSATNISATNYAIGLATATAPTSGDVFMKIPFTAGINTSVTFDMIVNSSTKQVTVGLTSGIVTINGKMISVYPNPANSTLFVNGLTEKSKVTIYDLSGKMIFNKQISENQIDISKLANGTYSIKIESAKGIVTKKFVKQ